MQEEKFPNFKYASYVCVILLLAYSVSYVDRQILSLMVGPIQKDLGINDTQLSLLQGFAFAIFYTSVGLAFGRAADHRNRRNLIIGGIIIWSLATAAGGLAVSFATLFLARVFVGVGEATLSPSAYSLLADYFAPEKRAKALSFYSLGVYLGSALAFIVGGLVVEATKSGGSWKTAFFLVSIPGFLVALLMTTVKEPRRVSATTDGKSDGQSDGQSEDKFDFSYIWARKRIYAPLILGYSTISIVTLAMMSWVPTFFIRKWGWTAKEIGLNYGCLILIFGLSGMMIAGAVADRFTARGWKAGTFFLSAAGSALLIPCTIWFLSSKSPMMALSAIGAITFFLGFPIALAPSVYNTITPNRLRGQVIALYLLANNLIGMSLGPTAVAYMTNYYFKDQMQVGRSLAIVCIAASFIGTACLAGVSKFYRDELDGTMSS